MEKRIEEGPPIYIESLMTPYEVKERCKKYQTSRFQVLRPLAAFEPGQMKWRYRMGSSLLPEEIAIINERIEQLKLKLKPVE